MANLKQQKVTVIGGSGFVGTHLCEGLVKNGIEFEIIDIKPSKKFPLQYKFGDVRKISSIQEVITGDIIVLLAAIHTDNVNDKNEYYQTNVIGAKNVAEVCKHKDIRHILFTSSVAVYGYPRAPTDELGRIDPQNEYGRTKWSAEEELRQWRTEAAGKLTIVRPTVIFGPGNRGNVYNLFSQIASGRFLMVGHGKNRKSMAYIKNVSAFLISQLQTTSDYALVNYADGPDMTMNELVSLVRGKVLRRRKVGLRIPFALALPIALIGEKVVKLLGLTTPFSAQRVKKFCSNTQFVSRRAFLTFEPEYSLSDAINETIESEFINPDPTRQIFHTE